MERIVGRGFGAAAGLPAGAELPQYFGSPAPSISSAAGPKPRPTTIGDGGGGNGGRPDPAPHGANRTGLILGLAAISMMFIGLTSAYVVSQGLNPLWKQVHMRPLIWIDTALLLFSSYTMERARRDVSSRWLIATLLLGITFLAGQIGVFAQLAQEGLYLNTGRQASFYYVLTGLHGLHIVGGVFALTWAALRVRRSTLDLTAIYWHFMDALWLYLLVVIFV